MALYPTIRPSIPIRTLARALQWAQNPDLPTPIKLTSATLADCWDAFKRLHPEESGALLARGIFDDKISDDLRSDNLGLRWVALRSFKKYLKESPALVSALLLYLVPDAVLSDENAIASGIHLMMNTSAPCETEEICREIITLQEHGLLLSLAVYLTDLGSYKQAKALYRWNVIAEHLVGDRATVQTGEGSLRYAAFLEKFGHYYEAGLIKGRVHMDRPGNKNNYGELFVRWMNLNKKLVLLEESWEKGINNPYQHGQGLLGYTGAWHRLQAEMEALKLDTYRNDCLRPLLTTHRVTVSPHLPPGIGSVIPQHSLFDASYVVWIHDSLKEITQEEIILREKTSRSDKRRSEKAIYGPTDMGLSAVGVLKSIIERYYTMKCHHSLLEKADMAFRSSSAGELRTQTQLLDQMLDKEAKTYPTTQEEIEKKFFSLVRIGSIIDAMIKIVYEKLHSAPSLRSISRELHQLLIAVRKKWSTQLKITAQSLEHHFWFREELATPFGINNPAENDGTLIEYPHESDSISLALLNGLIRNPLLGEGRSPWQWEELYRKGLGKLPASLYMRQKLSELVDARFDELAQGESEATRAA